MQISVLLCTLITLLKFSSESAVGTKKHETAEELQASGRAIQHRHKQVSEGIAAFDAYYKTAKMNNHSWIGPIPTLKPLTADYEDFGDISKEGGPPSGKDESYHYDLRDESTDNGRGDKDVDGNRNGSFETFNEFDFPVYEIEMNTTKAGTNETNASYEEII